MSNKVIPMENINAIVGAIMIYEHLKISKTPRLELSNKNSPSVALDVAGVIKNTDNVDTIFALFKGKNKERVALQSNRPHECIGYEINKKYGKSRIYI